MLFAPADRRWPGRRGSVSGSDGRGAVAAARAAPWGRLETVQKVCTRPGCPGVRTLPRRPASWVSGGLDEPCLGATDLLYSQEMRQHRVELVDDKFHIDGFPGAVKLIAISPLVKYLPEQLADMVLHHADLRFANECLEAMSSPAGTSPLVAEALWRSAVIHYCKCFGEHGSSRARLPYSKYLPVGLPREIHKYFMDLRNKHLVHDVNAWTQATPMAVVGPKEQGR